eukprot:233958-Prymnesium_polylepis.1
MPNEGLGAMLYQDISKGCSCETVELSGSPHARPWSPRACRFSGPPTSSPCSLTVRMAAEPVAGGQPVSIMQNVSGNLLDGEVEPHDLTGDAGDRQPRRRRA